ncbi:MAG: PAS domain S-box protein [Dehalococcoidales bacterium]|nr:PAS domain S-box protein [Dehalococcoidales bacterium]
MAPIVWAGFLFGWRGAFITSLAALAAMLPRAIFISLYPMDALFETGAVFILGNVLAANFHWLRKEREHRTQLEITQQELRTSEQRYRELFASAQDAIWLHDLEGNIITINKAAEKLTGYSVEELGKMNVKSFLSDESLDLAQQIRSKILNNEPVEQPYEQRIFRRDGSEAFIQLATSLILSDGKPVAFQHIARDVTEQRRMNENLRFYLQQAIRAQEEERKRISHELHDDTIQALVVLSRQLDALASGDKGLSEDTRLHLEELWQQTDNILRGVRRFSQDLRPAALDRLGMLPGLEWLAANLTEHSGIAAEVNLKGEERRLSEEAAIALFRITQEALRNVWRHSGATKAEITVEFDESKTRITISDNGKGFNLPGKIGDLAKSGKLGLTGMQERAQLIGGTLAVQSQPHKGTSVTVELPA